jgi:hypothetical protein
MRTTQRRPKEPRDDTSDPRTMRTATGLGEQPTDNVNDPKTTWRTQGRHKRPEDNANGPGWRERPTDDANDPKTTRKTQGQRERPNDSAEAEHGGGYPTPHSRRGARGFHDNKGEIRSRALLCSLFFLHVFLNWFHVHRHEWRTTPSLGNKYFYFQPLCDPLFIILNIVHDDKIRLSKMR